MKRWLNWCAVTHRHEMEQNQLGLYVLASDHEREVAALRAALQWYADNLGASKSMDYRIVHQDAGERARAALNQGEQR